MAKAISQLHNASSHDLGLYLAGLSGFYDALPTTNKILGNEDSLLKKYQEILTREAASSYDWNKFSEYLKVAKTKSNRVVVYIDGIDDLVERANLLEYGTPDKPAVPLMRTLEETFNSDFESKRMFKL